MSIGWPDLGGALLLIAGGLLVVAGLVGLLAWDARRRDRRTAILDVTAAVARVWLMACAIGVVFTIWRWLSGGDTWVPDLPVSLPWPEPLPCEQGIPSQPSDTTLMCAHVGTADATIAELGVGAKLLLELGEILGIVLAASPALLLVVVCAQALKGTPFSRTVGRWMIIVAVLVLVAGLGAELASSIGRSIAAAEVLPPAGAEPVPEPGVTTTGIYRVEVSLWPVGAALALGALGAVFRRGAVLQRETEGLV